MANGGKRKLVAENATSLACDTTYERVFDLLASEHELLDPNPDIHALFLEYNVIFFDGKLAGCEVKWSKRMTLCAGLCSFQPSSGFCSIRLSEPLLKLRPRSDLVNTLLHEMIHAYIFVFSPVRDREDHGPVFQSHMHRINQVGGTSITVFHTFHDEVDAYRQHWWKCDGPCQRKPPYFGVVKRAMNRPPGPTDRWWEEHQKGCGGTYTKIKEPAEYTEKQEKKKQKQKKKALPRSVKDFFPTVDGGGEKKPNDKDTGATGGVKPDKLPKKVPREPNNKKPPKTQPPGPPKTEQPPVFPKKDPEIPPMMDPSMFGNAVLVASDDGEFYLVGDIAAVFQGSSSQPRQILREQVTSSGTVVDLTYSDDEEPSQSTAHDRKDQEVIELE
ncbi:hypothetical protein Poli38472_010068 [Pythium oligandrum]|uniref:SprT-like domain-containing protein n=1 Tax=Pythium oligandrum TaxID=41045 RepID=A0A8K1C899_PYTOL|nr:hypothetical protein Poli38472_010068 [Pythium oligandrum]|eukprot:TMW58509.1 hypothetical protein Poli38472_010068 [Pythium oligandrum]